MASKKCENKLRSTEETVLRMVAPASIFKARPMSVGCTTPQNEGHRNQGTRRPPPQGDAARVAAAQNSGIASTSKGTGHGHHRIDDCAQGPS